MGNKTAKIPKPIPYKVSKVQSLQKIISKNFDKVSFQPIAVSLIIITRNN